MTGGLSRMQKVLKSHSMYGVAIRTQGAMQQPQHHEYGKCFYLRPSANDPSPQVATHCNVLVETATTKPWCPANLLRCVRRGWRRSRSRLGNYVYAVFGHERRPSIDQRELSRIKLMFKVDLATAHYCNDPTTMSLSMIICPCFSLDQ